MLEIDDLIDHAFPDSFVAANKRGIFEQTLRLIRLHVRRLTPTALANVRVFGIRLRHYL